MGDALHVDGGATSAKEARLAQAGLLALQGPGALDVRTGVLVGPGATALITGTSDTAPMTVQIGVHETVTARSSASGPYLGPVLEAPVKVNIGAAPAAGLSRIDVVYAKQGDADATVPSPDGATAPEYGVLAGTASSGTPTKPSLSSIVGAVEVGTVQVSAGATATNGANVVISNTGRLTTTRGGRIPANNRTDRAALTAFPTLSALEMDTARLLTHDGTRWRFDGDHLILTTEASAASLNAADVYPGLSAYAQDTKAVGIYDGTAWRWWDSVWQTYTLTVSTASSAPWAEITYGNGVRTGRYLRQGRKVTLDCLWQIGSSTNYSTGTGVIRFGYPSGLEPGTSFYLGNTNAPGGVCYSGASGSSAGLQYVLHEYNATKANRRMFMVSWLQQAMQAGSSGVLNLTGAGNLARWETTYEID